MLMKQYCDLHTHSCYSDGTCTPEEIVDMAACLALSAVALTDHNTVAGLPEFLTAAELTESLSLREDPLHSIQWLQRLLPARLNTFP